MTELEPVVDLVRRRTGLRLSERLAHRTSNVVHSGARRERCSSLLDYARLLERDDAALDRLVARLTVGETYFFRDASQVQLVASALRELASTSARISVWSAGCSTGEEAYTIAMLAAEVGLHGRVRVLGTDLSPDAIDRARAGRYGRWSLRGVDGQRRDAFFEAADGKYEVRSHLRRHVTFATGTVLGRPPGRYDLVLCRNVLIYLTDDAVTDAGCTLRDALVPDGWLVTGASDPPLTIPGLHRVRTPHGLAYRRQAATAVRPSPAPPVVVTMPVPPPVPVPRPASAPSPVEEVDDLTRLRRLADTAPRAEVDAALAAALASSPTDARLRSLAALLHLDWDEPAAALAHARAAVFLDPDLVVAQFVLGHAERRHGNAVAARRCFEATVALLDQVPGDAVVWGCDGRLAEDLAAVASQLAERSTDGG